MRIRYSPTQVSVLSLGQKKILMFILTYIPGTLRSYLMVLSRSDIGHHWFGKTVQLTGNIAVIVISHFLYLLCSVWQKHTFSTLFCISFCSGSSEIECFKPCFIQYSLLSQRMWLQASQGTEASHVPLGKQLPGKALVSLRIVIPTMQSCCENQMLCVETLVLAQCLAHNRFSIKK